ncbi:MAG: thiamine diphosphokinase [Candidatus Pacebacteria bacterium]|nr:thiamine diphosphokinase [Candidatus Paceibacterota bacterium]
MFNPDFDAIILADGLFPHRKEIRELITKSNVVVCCDGASQKLLDFGRIPDFVVGDLDSTPMELKTRFPEKMVYRPDQNSNDLTKSVEFCLTKGFKKLLIVGATGLREDHTLGNIALLHLYINKVEGIKMISDWGVFTAIVQTTGFDSVPGQQISLFSLTPETLISVEGLKYPIENCSLSSWWEGTLNEALGTHFAIKLHNAGKIIVYQAF